MIFIVLYYQKYYNIVLFYYPYFHLSVGRSVGNPCRTVPEGDIGFRMSVSLESFVIFRSVNNL